MFSMRRREFITILGGAAAAWPLAARTQQRERMRRIGVLTNLAAHDPEGQAHNAPVQYYRRAATLPLGSGCALKASRVSCLPITLGSSSAPASLSPVDDRDQRADMLLGQLKQFWH